MVHLKFACELMEVQRNAGRYFLYEHPLAASSWNQACVQEVMRRPDVTWVHGDQCQYGQQGGGHDPVKKPTKWMSNSAEVLKALEQRCAGRGGVCSMGGRHRLASGGRARAAAIYPFQLCKAILRGFRNQLRSDGRLIQGECGLQRPGVGRRSNSVHAREAAAPYPRNRADEVLTVPSGTWNRALQRIGSGRR